MRPLFCAFVLLLLGCGAAQDAALEPRPGKPSLSSPSTERSDQLGVFGAGTVGPYLGPTRGGWLAVWVEPKGERAQWVTRRVDREGQVLGEPVALASASPDTHLLKLVDLGDELLVLFTDRGTGDGRVGAFSLSPTGELTTAPQPFGRSARDVIWLDAVRTGPTALVFWAERKAQSAVVYAARWEPGSPLRVVSRVHAEARAWQVAPIKDGALLAAVTPDGEVELTRLDANAKALSTRSVADSQGANPDLDLAPHGDGLLLTFSRREAGRDVILSERLSAQGEGLGAAVRVLSSPESARVVRLLGTGGRTLLVWKNSEASNAALHAAWLGAEGRVEGDPVAVLNAATDQQPEFAANGSGVAVLLPECSAQSCQQQPGVQWIEAPSAEAAQPTERIQSWPSPSADRLAWGLSCEAKACAGLSAKIEDPIAVSVKITTAALARPAQPAALAQAAFEPAPAVDAAAAVVATEQLVSTPELADLAGITRPEGSLLSWVTQVDPDAPNRPAPDGRPAPAEALLQTQWAPTGLQLPPPEVISYRARSLAGVALAAKGDRSLLAWSALDGKSPQVFTTLLDPSGKRLRQAVQTTKQGEVFALDTAPLQAGWVLGWIDDRSSSPLSYVTQVSDKLKRLSRDLQYPKLQGEARALLTRRVGEEAWLLVVDAASAQNTLILQRFDAKEMQPLGPAVAVQTSADELSSPQLLVSGEQVWLLWISGVGAKAKAWAKALDLRGEAESSALPLAPRSQPVTLGGSCDEHGACGYWLADKAMGGNGRLTSPRILGGGLSADVATSQLWTGTQGMPVPLVRGDGSELWLSVGQQGVSRARLRWVPGGSK